MGGYIVSTKVHCLKLYSVRHAFECLTANHPFVRERRLVFHGSRRPSLTGRSVSGDVDAVVQLRDAYMQRLELSTGAEHCVPLLCGVSDALNFRVGRLSYEVAPLSTKNVFDCSAQKRRSAEKALLRRTASHS